MITTPSTRGQRPSLEGALGALSLAGGTVSAGLTPAAPQSVGPGVLVLFECEDSASCDLQWVVQVGTRVEAGEPVARAYRCWDGEPVEVPTPLPLTATEIFLERNRKVHHGDAILAGALSGISIDLDPLKEEVREQLLDLALAINASIKGFMGSIGESGQICEKVVPIQVEVNPEDGWLVLVEEIVTAAAAAGVRDGDVVVISEKLVAIAQGRLFPLDLLWRLDPKSVDVYGRQEILAEVAQHVPNVTADDLLIADSLLDWPGGPMATAGPRDPNGCAHALAVAIAERTGATCDIVVSDTDTGLDVRHPLIGCVTVGATPLGATAGLVLYECMRVANAAEFTRGSHRRIPIVICRPHRRRARRAGMGQHRGYPGWLQRWREETLAFI